MLRHPKLKTWNRFVNFTREPIIETIISPKEGYKLLVRSSKSSGPVEEYFVDAVEVVSFGRAFFFRSMERPKAFLVPASDYEILEVKETRVALKSATHDRNIKIGGGREASLRHQQQREPSPERETEPLVAEEQPAPAEEAGLEATIGARMEKRRDRRRRRHRRSEEDWSERRTAEPQQQSQAETEPKAQASEEESKVSSPMFSSLIPPPSTLISQTLGRYKDKEFFEGAPSEKDAEKEKKQKKEPPEEEASGSEPLHRIAAAPSSEALKLSSFTSTQFSLPQPDSDSFFF